MIKEEKPIFFKVFLIVIVILLINIGVFSFKITYNQGLTGLSIGEKISKAYINISNASKIFLFVQWFVLVILLAGVFIRDKIVDSKRYYNEFDGINMLEVSGGKGTDLDTLYKILKQKKELTIPGIAKFFDIKKDLAIKWCEVLQSGNLASIDYMSSKEPILRLIK